MRFTTRETCRACGGRELSSVLDFGHQPLANRFLNDAEVEWEEDRFPLHLVRCLTCGLAQLTVVVDPTILYGHYPYYSGISAGWREHCRQLAEEIGPGKSVLDIACNDGTLLRACRDNGCYVKGVDPSDVDAGDIPVVRAFWPTWVQGTYDVIVAQNVFGHVDDAQGFLEGVAEYLAPNGQAIIEVPWVVPMVCEGRWDTIYHEHLSYWGLFSLSLLADRVGLNTVDVRHFPDLHGGTIRFYLSKGPIPELRSKSFYFARGAEWVLKEDDWGRFAIRAYGDTKRWDAYLQNPQRKAIAAYGASAKLNTFLNALPNRPSIVGVFDDNPAKQNLYTPGWHIPVLIPTPNVMREVDVLLIGASNWKAEIEEKAKALGFTGEVVSLW